MESNAQLGYIQIPLLAWCQSSVYVYGLLSAECPDVVDEGSQRSASASAGGMQTETVESKPIDDGRVEQCAALNSGLLEVLRENRRVFA